jgi:LacI family transcriptional regulator
MSIIATILPKRFGNNMAIRDIAKKLGISITTVSRALDGYPDVSPNTRELVEKTAREMGYVPNRAARTLRRHRSDTIGFIIPSARPRFMDPFYSEFIAGLGDAAVSSRLDLLVSSAQGDDQAEMNLYNNWVQSRKVDGFVLNRIRVIDQRIQYLSRKGIQFTGLELSKDGVDYPRVEIPTGNAYQQLVNHLSARGFRRIGFIGGPDNLIIQFDRFNRFKESLVSCDLIYDPRLIILGDLTSASGYESTKRLLSLPDPPNAVICINDETGFGAMHAAHEMGLEVGRDFAVAGFDGVQASAYSQPTLTTIDQPVYQIATILVEMLAKKLNNQQVRQQKVVMEPNLLIRESTTGLMAK